MIKKDKCYRCGEGKLIYIINVGKRLKTKFKKEGELFICPVCGRATIKFNKD